MYALRYRPVGSPNWTTIDQITTGEYTAYLLSGLMPNVTYEAQLKSICSTTESSGYSNTLTFTPACQQPINLYASPKATTARLSWSTPYAYSPEAGATFQLQYRPLGSTNWLTVDNVVSASANLSTTYSLTGLTSNTSYEWRVRNRCSANSQSDYTVGTPFTTVCVAPSYAYGYMPSSTSIILRWSTFVEPGTLFDVRYRVTGAADWMTLDRLTIADNASTFAYSLTGLTNNKTYEWEIRTVCSAVDNSTYTSGERFTTGCQIPVGLSASPKTTSAYLSWALTGVGVAYDLRYRRSGTTAWTDISGLTNFSATITGLQTNTGYEWQVRSNCGNGILSAYSVSSSFGTSPCYSPNSQPVTILSPTSAKLSWYLYYGDNTTKYHLRYRVVGAPNWITLSDVTGAGSSGSAVVTNLTADSPHEWQVKAICSPTESSDFSASYLFQTCGAFYTLRAGFWYDTSTWSCHRIPTSYDVVQIKHTVTLPTGYTATALRVLLDPGTRINYGPNARLKLGQ